MVFSQLCELPAHESCGLICTSGQCRVASLVLLDMLRDSGCDIYYSGDYDPEGLSIADKLVKRGKGHIKLWHYSIEEYRRCMSDQEISASSLAQLNNITDLRLREIADVMKSERKAGYQEQFLYEYLQEIKKK